MNPNCITFTKQEFINWLSSLCLPDNFKKSFAVTLDDEYTAYIHPIQINKPWIDWLFYSSTFHKYEVYTIDIYLTKNQSLYTKNHYICKHSNRDGYYLKDDLHGSILNVLNNITKESIQANH